MAGKSGAEVALGLKIKARGLGEASNIVGAEACLAAGEYLVRNTPIDTGQAKSNWQASRGFPRTTTRRAYAVGKKGTTAEQNISAAIAQIRAECASRTRNQQMFLTNNLDYIQKLNKSGGNMGTPQFLQRAAQIARQVLRDNNLFTKALSGKAGVSSLGNI